MEAMVGTHMKASMMEALNRFRPVAMPNMSCSQGARMIMPIKPMTTDGSAAMSSISGFTMRVSAGGMPA